MTIFHIVSCAARETDTALEAVERHALTGKRKTEMTRFKRTGEFNHYPGCLYRDPANCSGCALTNTNQDAPNYAAWPIAYMESGRAIPSKWRDAFKAEMIRDDNPLYTKNIELAMKKYGVLFTDGKGF